MASRPVPDMEHKIQVALDYMADGNSMRKSCGVAGISVGTFLAHADAEQYARAREACADNLFDKLLDNAAAARDLDPQKVPGHKLACDVEKWCLARMKPKVYGERLSVAGDSENPLQVQSETMLKVFSDVPLDTVIEIAKRGTVDKK